MNHQHDADGSSRQQPKAGAFWLFELTRACRPYQWVKNLLVLLPFLLAHKMADQDAGLRAVLAAFIFCLVSSSVYIFNDISDIEVDRLHPLKKMRPFASGTVRVGHGIAFAVGLLAVAFTLASSLPQWFSVTILLYLVLNVAYSLKLKKIHSVDVVALAAMYTARIIAGAQASGLRMSAWLAAFSIFFFFGMALLKRYSEVACQDSGQIRGRGYVAEDKLPLMILGICSSLLSMVVMSLYINSPQVAGLYSRPQILWLTLPFFLMWISNIWVSAGRGKIRNDPIVYAIKNPLSYVVGILLLFVILAAL